MIPSNDEAVLVARARQGDRAAFSELVCRHYQGVIQVVYRMCGSTQLAEDAAQETFIQAWLKLGSYQPRSALRNWLYRIAVNTALDVLRREVRMVPDDVEDLELSDGQAGPEDTALQEEHTAIVQRAILSLPAASRAVLVLREYQELSYQEIANTLEIPLGTVMSRLSYARGLLKEALAAYRQVLLAEDKYV